MRRRRLLIAAGAALAAACTPASGGTSTTNTPNGAVPAGRPNDPSAGNPDAGIWPAFVSSAPAQTRQAYLYAAQHPEVLQYIPCYCGCGSATHNGGHADNGRCYVVSRATNGWMILEPHATACGTCVGITLDTKSWLTAGASLKEVRARIDQKWAAAGPSTPTKLPPG